MRQHRDAPMAVGTLSASRAAQVRQAFFALATCGPGSHSPGVDNAQLLPHVGGGINRREHCHAAASRVAWAGRSGTVGGCWHSLHYRRA